MILNEIYEKVILIRILFIIYYVYIIKDEYKRKMYCIICFINNNLIFVVIIYVKNFDFFILILYIMCLVRSLFGGWIYCLRVDFMVRIWGLLFLGEDKMFFLNDFCFFGDFRFLLFLIWMNFFFLKFLVGRSIVFCLLMK